MRGRRLAEPVFEDEMHQARGGMGQALAALAALQIHADIAAEALGDLGAGKDAVLLFGKQADLGERTQEAT
jgi:hypothetical protein